MRGANTRVRAAWQNLNGLWDYALHAWLKAIDPTRWVNPTSGWLDQNLGDVYDIHTYDDPPLSPVNKQDRAIVVGEYGGVGWPVADHLWDTRKRNWGYQTYHDQNAYATALLRKLDAILAMRRDIGLSAAVYTLTTDVEGEVNGFMTYDRRFIKIPAAKLAERNRAIARSTTQPRGDVGTAYPKV